MEVRCASLPVVTTAAGSFATPGSSSGAGELLQLMLDGAPRTRAELIKLTGLARSTVGSRVDALLAAGLLTPSGEAASTGGRPPSRLAFNPDAGIVLGADLGATHALVALTDLRGRVVAETALAIDISSGPQVVLDRVVRTARTLLRGAGRGRGDLRGVGVGVPGPVEHSTGRPVLPPIMPGWDGYDIPGHMNRALGGPVLVDNDVNLMALGELRSGLARGEQDVLYIKLGTGIAAGLVSGEPEPARALGQDTLQRARRVLGPDHVVVLSTGTALTHALDD
jgi:hypothetical protein